MHQLILEEKMNNPVHPGTMISSSLDRRRGDFAGASHFAGGRKQKESSNASCRSPGSTEDIF